LTDVVWCGARVSIDLNPIALSSSDYDGLRTAVALITVRVIRGRVMAT